MGGDNDQNLYINKTLDELKYRQDLLRFVKGREDIFYGLKELDNGDFVCFTGDYHIPDDLRVKKINLRERFSRGINEPSKLLSQEYSKVVEFFWKKSFGDLSLDVILRDDYVRAQKLDSLLNFYYQEGKGCEWEMPRSPDHILEFFKNRGLSEELLGKLENLVNTTALLISD
ncbi:hypothetical protein B6U91_00860 [Candidatus Pacearchaeota archaeon ex4484_71]|nr:MAG: hypothetical protein B6U91_00860 [Candidatus Pacearchaeota archaeon ex4484_71]